VEGVKASLLEDNLLVRQTRLIYAASQRIKGGTKWQNPTPYKIFFPIFLEVTSEPNHTLLTASTGPKTNSIHKFHRLLSTAYPKEYKKAVGKLHTMITEAINKFSSSRSLMLLSPQSRQADTKSPPNTPNNMNSMPKLPFSIKIAASGLNLLDAPMIKNTLQRYRLPKNSNGLRKLDEKMIKKWLRHYKLDFVPPNRAGVTVDWKL
tara:strand:+ start:4725 stop:5342 length:618 start_codon:yes stop_codon:yes gene_type:complete